MYRLNVIRKTLLALLVSIAGALSAAADVDAGYDAYQNGDYETAYNEWLPLAEQGNRYAQYNLGYMYYEGLGVVQDYAEAAYWYQLAADQGYGQYDLGYMYYEGLGVVQDYAEAVKYFRLAADQGDAIAQNNLGYMYYEGLGVVQDYVLAHLWYNIAASLGAEGARERRNAIGALMTSEQIATAQKLARDCVAQDYKDCGH